MLKDVDDLRDVDLAAVPATFFERWTAFADICNSADREAGALSITHRWM